MPTTLVVTNDFPPRIGGIESFVASACELLGGDVVVYTSGPPGTAADDRSRGYPVVRDGSLLLPTRRTACRAVELLRTSGATRVLFGAAAPLGLLAPALRAAGAEHIVALTHGHEVWWATLPGPRTALRRIGAGCDHLTTVSAYTAARIAPALTPDARQRLLRLPPPVDPAVFRPGGRAPRPRVVAVARFVRQKGLDTLLRAWARARSAPSLNPAAELVLVGDGPQRRALAALAQQLGVAGSVRFPGALGRDDVVAELQRAAVFALPVRTRLRGLNPEGFGLAAVEAASCGLPVLVGDSGGAPETVQHGVTGWVLPPDDVEAWAVRIGELLSDPDAAVVMGRRGQARAAALFGPEAARATLARALRLAADPA